MPPVSRISTSLAEGFPASPGRSLASGAALPTNGTSGRSSIGLSKSFDLDWFLGRMSEGLSTLGLTMFSATLKPQTTPAGRLWWRLRMSVRRTSESASSLWPSPITRWLTPTAHDAHSVTRTAEGWAKRKAYRARIGRHHIAPAGLYEQMQLVEDGLSMDVRQWPEGKLPEPRGHLNPDWVETLMGFPVGWTRVDGLPDQEPRKPNMNRRGSPKKNTTALSA
jgi:hypothetical protein